MALSLHIDTAETDAVRASAPLICYTPITPLQNATGQPAINFPLHWSTTGFLTLHTLPSTRSHDIDELLGIG
jgi:hypothetical protein